MENKKRVMQLALWVAALMWVLAGAIMIAKGKNGPGAAFLALGSFWIVFAMASAKKK